jgi:phosphoserine phosphatase
MARKTRFVLVTANGNDEPGVTSSLTEILSQYKLEILDLSQSVIHNKLSLSYIIELPDNENADLILKEMLFRAYELKLEMQFNHLNSEEYKDWVRHENTSRFIVTIVGRHIYASHINIISSILAENDLNIMDLERLSERIPIKEENSQDYKPRACIQISVSGSKEDLAKVRKDFLKISMENNVDVAIQEDTVFRRHRRLVAFDMDSTLIQTEVIDELAIKAGVGDQVKSIAAAAMRGEIDFDESLRQRVGLLKGLSEDVMSEIAENLPVTEGAARLVKTLKTFGYKVAVISGGFTYFGQYLQNKLGLDYVFANNLVIEDGKCTGEVLGDIVNGPKKAEILKELCEIEGIQLEQTIAVGDGANDLPMLGAAGLGIAFHAKPIVRENAEMSMSQLGLDSILYLMGFRDREINNLLK